MVADLGSPAGVALVREVLDGADLVGDGLGPGGLERLGLWPPPSTVRALVRFHTDGGEDTEPELVAAARGGLLALTGEPQRPPVPFGVPLVGQLAGAFGALQATAALLADPLAPAESSGLRLATVQPVTTKPREESPLVIYCPPSGGAFRVTEWAVPAAAALGRIRLREGNTPSTTAPLGVYASADGSYVALVGGVDANFKRLTRAMQRPDLANEERFATARARVRHVGEIDAIVAAWVGSHDAVEIERRCIASGVPASRVMRPDEMMRTPHFLARPDFVAVDDPTIGRHLQAAPHPRFEGVVTRPQPAPRLGEHERADRPDA